jgi:hypothetical protein
VKDITKTGRNTLYLVDMHTKYSLKRTCNLYHIIINDPCLIHYNKMHNVHLNCQMQWDHVRMEGNSGWSSSIGNPWTRTPGSECCGYNYKGQWCHSLHQVWWWRHTQSLKHWILTPFSRGWSPEKTYLHVVIVKASNPIYTARYLNRILKKFTDISTSQQQLFWNILPAVISALPLSERSCECFPHTWT